jgi:tetratricopeptide (TPR) repeat protein
VKIFLSYSRRDAGDFANQIQKHLSTFNYHIFIDVNSIKGGDIWNNTIEENISGCDIFVVIVTHGALYSLHVEREVLQAQREEKTIIPCFYRDVIGSNIKWGLEKLQGVEFSDKYEIARNLHSEIANMSKEGIAISTDQDINTLIKYGDILYDQSKYLEAIEWYDKVLRIDPNNEFVSHKRFIAIQHLPKSSFKIYSNVKIKAKEITPELISYLEQKDYKVVCNPDYKNNTYFINASITVKQGKLSKLTKTYVNLTGLDYSDSYDMNIKVRDYLSNLEIFLLTPDFKIKLYGIVSISLKNKLRDDLWKFIDQKISSY